MAQDWTDDVYDGSHAIAVDMANIEKNFACLKSSFSGPTAPANPVTGMLWLDTNNKQLKVRNDANSAWVVIWDFTTGKCPAAQTADTATNATSATTAADADTLDGQHASDILTAAKMADYIAGDLLITSSTGYISYNQTTYVKVAEIKVGQRSGTIRVRTGLRAAGTSIVYCRVYINGVAVGSEHSTNNTTMTYFADEDFAVSAGDLVQVYGKTGGGSGGEAYIDVRVANPTDFTPV